MLYPSLSSNAKSLNVVSKDVYSPFYDIVWSFDYIIKGSPITEGGFTAFLCLSGLNMNDSEGGIDLGYSISPLKLNILLDTSSEPQSSIQTENEFNVVVAEKSELDYNPYRHGGVLAIGFDSTGLFAASATMGPGATRDGLPLDKIYNNSITIRGGFPKYSFKPYNFHKELSSIDSEFKLIEDTLTFKTIRVRLGNVGRTIYVDYRYSPEEEFKNLITQDVTLNFTTSTFYHAGVSFASPISSIRSNRIGKMHLKNLHVEGTTEPNLNIYSLNLGTTTTTTTTTTLAPTTTPAPIIPPLPIPVTTPPPLGVVTLGDGNQIFRFNDTPIYPLDGTAPPPPTTPAPTTPAPTTPAPTTPAPVQLVPRQIGDDLIGKVNYEMFGAEVTISGDGNTVAIATGDYAQSSYSFTASLKKYSYVRAYSLVGTKWQQIGGDIYIKYGEYGSTVALNGDGSRMVIGTPYLDAPVRERVSAVGIYNRVNGEFVLSQNLLTVKSYAYGFNNIGYVVKISNDGNRVLVATGEEIVIFDFNGVEFIETQRINIERVSLLDRILPTCIALSKDGNFIIVGNDPVQGTTWRGRCYIYKFTGSKWILFNQILSRGRSVSINYNGTRCASYNGYTTNGKVEVFDLVGTGYTKTATISIIGNSTNTNVELNDNGDRLLIGSPYVTNSPYVTPRCGKVLMYRLINNTWSKIPGAEFSGVPEPLAQVLEGVAQSNNVIFNNTAMGASIGINGKGDKIIFGSPSYVGANRYYLRNRTLERGSAKIWSIP